jgi:hypothetical protein
MPEGDARHKAMSDRDCLLMVFNAICGLAERMTRERMVVSLDLEAGGRVACYGEGITWERAFPAASANPADLPAEHCSRSAEPA